MPQIYRNDDRSTVIRKIVQSIEHHNPGRYRIEVPAMSPAAQAPDIILYEGDAVAPALVIAVETAESLGRADHSDRWAAIAAVGTLQVYAPKSFSARAKTLIRKSVAKARLIEY